MSYYKHWFLTAIPGVYLEGLKGEVQAAGYDIQSVSNDLQNNGRVGLDLALVTLSGPQQTQLQGIIDAHSTADQTNVATNWKVLPYVGVWKRSIDTKSVATHLIARVPLSKGPFLVEWVAVRLAAIAGLTSVPTVSLGTNAPTYDNLVAATAMTNINAANQLARPPLVARAGIVAADTEVYVRVSGAAVATTYTIDTAIIGFFLNGQ